MMKASVLHAQLLAFRFWAVGSALPLAHSPESPCPWRAWHWSGRQSPPHRRLSCRAFAGHGRSQIDNFVGVFVHREEVLSVWVFFLPVLLLLLGGIGGPWRRRSVPSMAISGRPLAPGAGGNRLASRSGRQPEAAKARCKTGSK